MKLSRKVFLAMFAAVAAALALSGAAVSRVVARRARAEYLSRYQDLSRQVASTLVQIDRDTDALMANALYALRERDRRGLPSNADLMAFKRPFGVDTFYITDDSGRFIRSDWFVTVANDPRLKALYPGGPLKKSLFSYCADYRRLLSAGGSERQETPIIPSGQARWPFKYVLIPNHDRTRVLEADMAMGSVGRILEGAVRPDSNLLSIGLFSPNGEVLGYFHSGQGGELARLDPKDIAFDRPVIGPKTCLFYTRVETPAGDCCECRTKGLTLADGNYYYILRTEVSTVPLEEQLAGIRGWILGIALAALILAAPVASFVSRRIVQELVWIGDRMKSIAAANDLNMRLRLGGQDEASALAERFDSMMDQLQSSHERLAGAEREKAFADIAGQVAHDIRSPLAALDAATSGVESLPEDDRLMIRSAVSRIRDIANRLLDEARPALSRPGAKGEESRQTVLLSSLIDPLLTEKRLQFQPKSGVEIRADLGPESYGLFARVDPGEFKRVLSNLINNAVEAIPERGFVAVSLARKDGSVSMSVQDNGPGIASAIMERLGGKGQTYGKAGGLGLGLHHAKACAESWGGSLQLASEPGSGTTVTLRLPAAPAPAWFVSRLELAAGRPVVILDDDPTIHQIWQGRLDSALPSGAGIEVFHFSSARELRSWARGNPQRMSQACFLLDYQLRGETETGLSLTESLGIGSRTILVTSRFEEKPVLEQCLRLGARMIPKGLAGFVPIAVTLERERPDAILIDDDKLVRAVWSSAARAKGKALAVFASAEEFRAACGRFSMDTPIYVDSELGVGVRGEEFARELHARGFRELRLATGHRKDAFPPMDWIREIVGKDAPWPV